MGRHVICDEEMEKEIAELSESEAVRLARLEQRVKYYYRQRLYQLRYLEKRGKELIAAGITDEMLKESIFAAEETIETKEI